jgi:tripartite-type tricarboxylate transporter receptor subunit TctC
LYWICGAGVGSQELQFNVHTNKHREEQDMKWIRRILLIGGALLASICFGGAAASDYPRKPIRVLVGFVPGGSSDVVARLTAQKLSEKLGQSIVVDNRPGADGIVASEVALQAAPDGYTLLFGNTGHATNPSFHVKLPYDTMKDFIPITNVGFTPLALDVNTASPLMSVKELIALAKAKPGQLTFASAGIGNVNHVAGLLFQKMAGVKMIHVPYKGGAAALADLITGRVSLQFDTLPSTLPFIRAGKLRALGVTCAQRTSALQEIPTIAESGLPGFEVTAWYGLFAPAGTPSEIIGVLSRALINLFQAPQVRELYFSRGVEVVGDTPEHFQATLQAEIAKWRGVSQDPGAFE